MSGTFTQGERPTSSGKSSAKTGDPLSALSGVFAVTAAAGAAMAVYSKRRTENERAKASEDE